MTRLARILLRSRPAAAPLAAGAAALALSWQTWIQPFVDSSRELMVPERMARGERLYRDVVYYYGPLGPWLNSAVLKIFGPRWFPLEIVGAALGAAALLALFFLVRRAGSALSAVCATTLAAAVCMGAPRGGAFVFPYAFDALLAVAAALAGMALFAGPPGRIRDIGAGAALAAALASKVEIGGAALLVVVLAAARGSQFRRSLRIAAGGGFAALAAYGYAFRGVPAGFLSTQGPLAIFHPPAPWRQVYAFVAGLDDPAGSLSRIATAAFLDLLLISAAFLAARVEIRFPSFRRAVALTWAAGVAAVFALVLSPARSWLDSRLPPMLLPVPLLAAAAAVWVLRRPLGERDRARFLLFGLSAALASRVFLNLAYQDITTPYSILAFPALAGAASVLGLDLLPAGRPEGSSMRRNLAIVFAALAFAALMRLARWDRPARLAEVRTAAGELRLPRAQAGPVSAAVGYLASRARPGDELATFPEAGLFNFATGLSNPIRQDQVLPGHLDGAAEARVSARLLRRGPRFVLLVNQPTAAFGQVSFGQDYASALWQTVLAHYHPAAVFGDPNPSAPVGAGPFFVRIYERNGAGEGDG